MVDDFDDLVSAAMRQVEREEREVDAQDRKVAANRGRIGELREQTILMESRVIETASGVARELRGYKSGRIRILRSSDRGAIVAACEKIDPVGARGPRFLVERRQRKAREYRITETERRAVEGWELGVGYGYVSSGNADLGSSDSYAQYVLGVDGVLYENKFHPDQRPMDVAPATFELLSAGLVPKLNKLKPADEQLIGRLEHLLDRQNQALQGLALLTARYRRNS
jgi:hypothetical protein